MMITDIIIETARLSLKNLDADAVSDAYYRWMNDAEVIRYLEVESGVTKRDLADYIQAVNYSTDTILFGIFNRAETHIGNVKLGPVLTKHRRASIGIIIGNKKYWGMGIASEVIAAIVDYAFQKFDISKLTAGCYADNLGSVKAFENNDFQIEARLINHVQYQGKPHDVILLAKHLKS